MGPTIQPPEPVQPLDSSSAADISSQPLQIAPQQQDSLPGYDGMVPQASAALAPTAHSEAPSKKKALLIAAGAAIGVLLVVVVVAVLAGANKSPTKTKPKATVSDDSGAAFLKPATAIGTEQTSNSISQDLSSLNDDSDFPPNKINDKALGL